jgi:hypothetical protein
LKEFAYEYIKFWLTWRGFRELSNVNQLDPSYQKKWNEATCPNSWLSGGVVSGGMFVMNPCICKVVTNVFYLNLNSIHSWKSVTRVVVVFVKPVAGLNTSGDHAPASATNDPAETVADPGLAVPVLGTSVIDGIEL